MVGDEKRRGRRTLDGSLVNVNARKLKERNIKKGNNDRMIKAGRQEGRAGDLFACRKTRFLFRASENVTRLIKNVKHCKDRKEGYKGDIKVTEGKVLVCYYI